ncbi:hypothetical protein [Anatilimnocola floriformis]|uniref:hypothetical protein n=1 Tax=Anatilimnocola floriformis TaxID=2948575 RepID=UPI0020C25AC1|nr:hypothetical protein [Anatilimnocola floriformis]
MTYKLPRLLSGLLLMLAVAGIGYFSGSRGAGMFARALAQAGYGQPGYGQNVSGPPGNGQPGYREVVPFSGAGQGRGAPAPYAPPLNPAQLPQPQAQLPQTPLNYREDRVASNPPSQPLASVDGNALVAQAARRVQTESSVQAAIRFRIDVAGQNLVGNGQYVQLGDGPEKLLRFDLKLQVGQRVAALQQISGQQYYWIRRDLPPANFKVSRVNLLSIRNAVAKRHLAADRDSDMHGVTSPADDAWLLLGGLPALLESLSQDFEFGEARQGEIELPGGNSLPTRVPVWAVSGTWKKERWKELTTVTGKKKKDAPPPLLPKRVDLVLNRSERAFGLFPYRVLYYAAADDGRGGQGTSISMRPVVSMELFNLATAANLDPRDFDYNPGEQEVEDLTAVYLQRLGLGK